MFRKYEQMFIGQIPGHWGNRPGVKEKIAVACDDGTEITWEEFNKRTNRVARLLKSKGVKRGDKVAFYMNNNPYIPEIIFAIAKIGACVVPIAFRFIANEVRDTIELADVVAIFTHSDLAANAYEAAEGFFPKENVIVVDKDDPTSYNEMLAAFDDSDVELDAVGEDLFWMAFTGGTTGKPKACMVTNYMMMTYANLMTIEYGACHDDKMLISGAMNYGLSFMHTVQMLYLGGTIYIMRSFDGEGAIKIIEKEKITVIPMVPTMYNAIVSVPNKEKYDVSSVRVMECTGAPLPVEVKVGVINYFANGTLNEFYGVSELGMFTTAKIKKGDSLDKVGSIGLPAFGMELKILDENGKECGVGEVGDLHKRGPLLSIGYYKNEKATEELFHGEWAFAGDLGYVDEDGYYYLVGRSKDMIISGGVNLYPAELENFIMNIPGVQDVSVIGVPHETLGEVARAYIVRKDDADGAALTEESIINACMEGLARYKRPRSVGFIAELPKSVAGKVLKRELSELYKKELENK